MNNRENNLTQLRRAARLIGLALGAVLGLLYLLQGFQVAFSLGRNDTWITITAAGLIAIGPIVLALVGIWRTRTAAYGYFIYAGAYMFVGVLTPGPQNLSSITVGEWGRFTLLSLLPPLVVGLLLLYSTTNEIEGYSNGLGIESGTSPLFRANAARWTGIALGVSAGSYNLWFASHWMSKLLRFGEWDLALLAAQFGLLPLTVFGIAKPRLSAYLILGCVLTTGLAGLYGGIREFAHSLSFSLVLIPVLAVPILVAYLLWYSTTAKGKGSGLRN